MNIGNSFFISANYDSLFVRKRDKHEHVIKTGCFIVKKYHEIRWNQSINLMVIAICQLQDMALQ